MTGFVKADTSLVNEVVIALDARHGYRAAAAGLAPVSTITDFFALINTDQSRIVLPKYVRVSGFIATAAVAVDLYLVKRNALSTGQTVAAVANQPLDTKYDPASFGAAQSWAAAGPTTLAQGVTVGVQKLYLPVSPALPSVAVWDFSAMKPPVVRNGEYLALNFGGQSWVNAMSLDVEIEWEEV